MPILKQIALKVKQLFTFFWLNDGRVMAALNKLVRYFTVASILILADSLTHELCAGYLP